MKEELDRKNMSLAKAEEQCLVLEAWKEDVAYSMQDFREEKEKLLVELKKKHDKTAKTLKEAKAAKKEAERRCRLLEQEREAICDDYEGRLQQQASNYEAQLSGLPAAQVEGAPAEGADNRLQGRVEGIDADRKATSKRLRAVVKQFTEKEERLLSSIDYEKNRADQSEEKLEACRTERDAECERLQKNIDSLKEQLDVKAATVKHLWEKVAAIRRAHLDEAVSARDSLSRLAEDQQEQIDRLRRRARRKEEEITRTVLARLQAQNQFGSTSSLIDEDEVALGLGGGMAAAGGAEGEGGGGHRESLDSAQGTTKRASAALRSQLADIKAERMDLMCKCQRQEQQVADLRKLVDEISKLEAGAPDLCGDTASNWDETQSVCSDVSGMSLDSSLMPRGVEDISEKDLRELARWFKARSGERRRLLRRYKAGRQKTEALAARKQAGGDMFPSSRGMKSIKGALARSPTSDTESVKSAVSGRSARSVRSAKSASTTASNI
ncbi:unnamed protein product, partial [Scytosiphon promiscuus]